MLNHRYCNLKQIESSEVIFLRLVADYRRMVEKRNTDIRQELNILTLEEQVKYTNRTA